MDKKLVIVTNRGNLQETIYRDIESIDIIDVIEPGYHPVGFIIRTKNGDVHQYPREQFEYELYKKVKETEQ